MPTQSSIRHTFLVPREFQVSSNQWDFHDTGKPDYQRFAEEKLHNIDTSDSSQRAKALAKIWSSLSSEEKWKYTSIDGNEVVLRDLEGQHEFRYFNRLPSQMQKLFGDLRYIQISWKKSHRSSLLEPVSPRGLTIEIDQTADPEDTTCYEYLNLITGSRLIDDTGISSFIDVEGIKIFSNSTATSRALEEYLSSSESALDCGNCIPKDIRNATFIKITLDVRKDQLSIEITRPTPPLVKIGKVLHQSIPVEIGIVQEQQSKQADVEDYAGLQAFVGDSTDFAQFFIFFPNRFTASEAEAQHTLRGTGSHLTIRSLFSGIKDIVRYDACQLFNMYHLPREYFIDEYQIRDSHPPPAHRLQLYGEKDLEAPSWEIRGWGSILLARIETDRQGEHEFELDIPIHARYLPASNQTYQTVAIPAPTSFFACPSTLGNSLRLPLDPINDVDFDDNPFDSFPQLYKVLFPENTVFHMLQTKDSSFTSTIPVANSDDAEIVVIGTLSLIMVGSSWLLYKIWKHRGRGVRTLKYVESEKKTK